MRVILVTTPLLLSLAVSQAAGQAREPSRGLPMAEVEACRIQFTLGGDAGRWGGQIAIYDASTDEAGGVVTLSRRVIDGREHLPRLVRLDQFESCVRRWRFDGRDTFTISLLGGTTYEGAWIIEVAKQLQKFRLRLRVDR
jgi:hypothetical protein